MAQKEMETAMAKHDVTVKATFVPLSRSRNADTVDERKRKVYSLNWIVEVMRGAHVVLRTDYMAGMGHCPSYDKPAPEDYLKRYGKSGKTTFQQEMCSYECENGVEARFTGIAAGSGVVPKRDADGNRIALTPKAGDVLYSLMLDASVIDYGGFENWAAEYGYDTDSRKAEKIYRECLESALALRAGLSREAFDDLQNACQDY